MKNIVVEEEVGKKRQRGEEKLILVTAKLHSHHWRVWRRLWFSLLLGECCSGKTNFL